MIVEFETGDALVKPLSISEGESGATFFCAAQAVEPHIVGTGCRVGDAISLTLAQRDAVAERAVQVCHRALVGSGEVGAEVEVLEVVSPRIGGHFISGTIHKYAAAVKATTPIQVIRTYLLYL